MPHSPEASPLPEKEIRDMKKTGERMMTREEKEVSEKREERFIELGKDGQLRWEGLKSFGGDGDWYIYEVIDGVAKGHNVYIMKRAVTETKDEYHPGPTMLSGRYTSSHKVRGYTYEGSIDGRIQLSDDEAKKLFQKYTGIATDKEMVESEEAARKSAREKNAAFEEGLEKNQVVLDLLND